ncbi:MAG TPA: histidine kinase [Streptosporangiaceae bacterium]|jgi:signal transduction histidine kinase|nr:histidine kinase [Streptosporangiaceae bacterium]
MLVAGDASPVASEDNGFVDTAGDWRSGAAEWPRRLATVPHAPAVAAGLVGVAAAAQAVAQPGNYGGSYIGDLQVAFVLLSLFGTLPLGLLWAYPTAAALAVSVASVLSLSAFRTLTVAAVIAQLAALYRLGRSGRQLVAAALALPFLALALTFLAPSSAEPGISAARVLSVILAALGPAAAWAGAAWRARSEAAQHEAARQVIAGSLVEHTARGERARVSHELHDVVAHHISMIAVQAETARLTTAGMPAAGAQRLSAIGDTARAALTEMRRLLGVLREDTRTGAAVRQPQPGLLQLNELLDEARDASGSGIRLIVSGPMAALDPGVELAAYRIIQEALTNARRHAEGAAVDVELHYTAEALRLRVRDNGPGPPPDMPPGGHGLLGMRERAAAVGGELRAGAANGGGFVVEAVLPVAAEAAA